MTRRVRRAGPGVYRRRRVALRVVVGYAVAALAATGLIVLLAITTAHLILEHS